MLHRTLDETPESPCLMMLRTASAFLNQGYLGNIQLRGVLRWAIPLALDQGLDERIAWVKNNCETVKVSSHLEIPLNP